GAPPNATPTRKGFHMGKHLLSELLSNSSAVPIGPRHPVWVTGQSLAKTPRTKIEANFCALDLHLGLKHLVFPTVRQAAGVVPGATPSGVSWAKKRDAHREEILRGELPLVPPPAPKAATASRSNEELIAIFREEGLDRVLSIAAIVESMIVAETMSEAAE